MSNVPKGMQASSGTHSKLKKNWSLEDIVATEEKQSSIFSWWYHLTAVPDPPANASYSQREEARRIRLLSTVLFFVIPIMVIAVLTCFFIPNRVTLYIAMTLLFTCTAALLINRSRRPIIAGIIVVLSFQISIMAVILTTTPLDETALQLADLFILTELFAVSLLPARYVFLVAFCNMIFIITTFIYQPRTEAFDLLLSTQFLPILSRPLSLQIIVAGVAFLWVESAIRAITRADRAEMVAKLEHQLGEQQKDLEQGIEQILQTHVAVANGNLNARAPLSQDNMLWQIARALNTLLVRLQRAVQAERELYRVEQAVAQSVQMMQIAEQKQQLPRLNFTQTAIDPLIAALQGKTLSYTQSPFIQRNQTEDSGGFPKPNIRSIAPGQ